MIWLLSGEGKTDFGQCNPPTELCEDGQFEFGPMTLVVDKLCLNKTHSSLSVLPSTPGNQTFLFSKQALVDLAKSLKGPKSLSLPGGKRRKDGLYFEREERHGTAKSRVPLLLRGNEKHALFGEFEVVVVVEYYVVGGGTTGP